MGNQLNWCRSSEHEALVAPAHPAPWKAAVTPKDDTSKKCRTCTTLSMEDCTGNSSTKDMEHISRPVESDASIGVGKDFAADLFKVRGDAPVAIALHTLGTYGISSSGKSTKFEQGASWGMSCIAIPISDETVMVLHGMGIYKLNVKTGANEKIKGSSWSESKVLLRCKRDPEHVLCLHSHGAYKINISTGDYQSVGGWSSWSRAKEAVYDPETDHCFVFHGDGIYKVDPKTAAYSKVGNDWGWSEANASVYHSSGAFIFHSHGTYRVNLSNGSYDDLGGSWNTASNAVKNGPDSALVLTSFGTYEVNLSTGKSQKLPDGESWDAVQCATNLGADVMAASKYVPHDHHES